MKSDKSCSSRCFCVTSNMGKINLGRNGLGRNILGRNIEGRTQMGRNIYGRQIWGETKTWRNSEIGAKLSNSVICVLFHCVGNKVVPNFVLDKVIWRMWSLLKNIWSAAWSDWSLHDYANDEGKSARQYLLCEKYIEPWIHGNLCASLASDTIWGVDAEAFRHGICRQNLRCRISKYGVVNFAKIGNKYDFE